MKMRDIHCNTSQPGNENKNQVRSRKEQKMERSSNKRELQLMDKNKVETMERKDCLREED